MPQNLRAIRRKIRTVRSIWKITRAMKMVAAAKLRRVQDQVERGRAYWDRLDEILHRVASQAEVVSHPLLLPNDAETVAVVVIGGERGLCGSYNAALLRYAGWYVARIRRPLLLITVGAKAMQYFRRRGMPVEYALAMPDERERVLLARNLSRRLQEMYVEGDVGEVHMVFTRYHSPISHRPDSRLLLPVTPPEVQEGSFDEQYIYEPPAEELLGSLLPRALDSIVYETLLQSAAAEEGARMTAMTAATDNAEQMITDLTRDLNRARQTQITAEILEVVSGAEAVG